MDATVNEILKHKGTHVYTAAPTTPVLDVAKMMQAHSVGCVVVVGGLEVMGIISERDIVSRIAAERRDAASTVVADVMTRRIWTVTPETRVREAMWLVSRTRCRHLPVLGPHELVGLISAGDVMAWHLSELQMELTHMDAYIHGPHSISSRPPLGLP